jgi:signal peptidase I
MIKSAIAFFFDILQTIVLAAAMFVIVYLFVAQPHIIKGVSMEPNFQNGEYILTEKVTYLFMSPSRGDVVVFEAPNRKNADYIKRVIGLPGDTVSVLDGKVYINGEVLTEDYEPNTTNPGNFMQEGQDVIVPPDMYIVLGDNRPQSSDSREFGPVEKDSIVGRAILRYWPLSVFSRIITPSY